MLLCLVEQKAVLTTDGLVITGIPTVCSVYFHPVCQTLLSVFQGGSGNETTSESCSPAYKLTIFGDVENFSVCLYNDPSISILC